MTAPTRPITIVPEPPIVDPQSFVPVMPKLAVVFPPDTIITGPIIKRPNGPDIPSAPAKADYFAAACEQNPEIPADGFDTKAFVVSYTPTGHIVVAPNTYFDITSAYEATKAAEAGDIPLVRATLPANESQPG